MKANRRLINALRRTAKRIELNIDDEYDWSQYITSITSILVQEMEHVGEEEVCISWDFDGPYILVKERVRIDYLTGEDMNILEKLGGEGDGNAPFPDKETAKNVREFADKEDVSYLEILGQDTNFDALGRTDVAINLNKLADELEQELESSESE